MTSHLHSSLRSAASLSLWALLALTACDPNQPKGEPLPPKQGSGAPNDLALPEARATTKSATEFGVDHRWIGSAQAKHHVELAPKFSGTLAEITVEEGEAVKQGQFLFRVEGSEVKLAVAQAAAAVAAAEVQVSEAEREAGRTRTLAAKGSIGSANLERAEGGVDAANAGLKQAKAAAAVARARTSDLRVESPIDGIVTAKLKSVGEMATTMPPTTVLVIDDLSTIEVRVRVPELELRELDVGTPVTVHFPALDKAVDVPITRIGNSVDARTRTIELIIDVPNEDLRIKGGMSVEVELAKPKLANEAVEQPAAEPTPAAAAEQPAGPDGKAPAADSVEPPPTAMIGANASQSSKVR